MQHQQFPFMHAIDGGATVDFDGLELEAWRELADACERALVILGPSHPERRAFLTMTTEVRIAADLPPLPSLRRTG